MRASQPGAKESRQKASAEGKKMSHKQLSWPSVPAQRSLRSWRTHQASHRLLLMRPTNSATTDRFCDKLENDFWGNCLQFSEIKFTEVSEWLKGQEAVASEWGPRAERCHSHVQVCEKKIKMKTSLISPANITS